MTIPPDIQVGLGNLLPKPTPVHPPLQSEASGVSRGPPTASTPSLNPLQPFNEALKMGHESKLAPMHALNNPLAVGLNSAFGPRCNLFNPPHCDAPGCRLERGCDVFYDPHNDHAYQSQSRKERLKGEKQYEKYLSPFQIRERSESPKRRKTSHDDSANEASPDHRLDFSNEPATPFSQKSWLALEFFLIVCHNIVETPSRGIEIVMKASQRLIPDLDYEECVVMDLLRLHYPEPNIYSDNDEDESTEGAKLHKLHLKVYDMRAEELNPTMDALCQKLLKAGYRYDGVLLPAAMAWEDSAEEDPYDDHACNYTLLGADEGKSWLISPVHKDAYDYRVHKMDLDDNADIRMEQTRDRNFAMQNYERRLSLSALRLEEATEAVRLVRELEGGYNSCRIQVPFVRSSYAKEGKFWPAHFSHGLDPKDIEPRRFARWVDNLSDRQYNYAKESILKWMNAGVELDKSLAECHTTGTSMWKGGQTLNPQLTMPVGLSPKRKFSISWPEEDEVPSNRTPDWVAEEQQLRYSMTEDELLRRALQESMMDSQPTTHQAQPKLPTPTPSPTPTVDRRRDLSRSQRDELDEKVFQWVLKASLDPSLGKFPEEEVIDELLDKTGAHNTLRYYRVAADSYTSPHPPLPGIDHLLNSRPRKDFVLGGADGVHDINIDHFGAGFGPLYKESFEREKPLSRSPPASLREGTRGLCMKGILNAESPSDIILPSVEIAEVSESERSDSKKQPAEGEKPLAKIKNGLKEYQNSVLEGGVDGACELLPDTPPSLGLISSDSSESESLYRSAVKRSQSLSADKGRKRSIDHIENAEGGARRVSPTASNENAALQEFKLQVARNLALCAQGSYVIPNPFRTSNRNRRSNVSLADREKVDRWTSRARDQANTDVVENKGSFELQQRTVVDVDTADYRASPETARLKRLALELAHQAEYIGWDNLQKKQPDFEREEAELRALEQARLAAGSAARELKWLKEDQEWKMILRSDKSLGELLMTGNVPYTRRCEAVVDNMWRTEARPGWIGRAEKKKNVAFLGVVSNPSDSSDAESKVPLLSRSFPASPEATGNWLSSANATQESISQNGEVDTATDELSDGPKARSAAIAAAYANRPSGLVSGVGEFTHELTEPLPDHMEEPESIDARMPVADIGVRAAIGLPNQTTGDVVKDQVGVVDGSSSPDGQQVVAQTGRGELLHSSREAYPSESDVWEKAANRGDDVKVPLVNVAEVQFDDLEEA